MRSQYEVGIIKISLLTIREGVSSGCTTISPRSLPSPRNLLTGWPVAKLTEEMKYGPLSRDIIGSQWSFDKDGFPPHPLLNRTDPWTQFRSNADWGEVFHSSNQSISEERENVNSGIILTRSVPHYSTNIAIKGTIDECCDGRNGRRQSVSNLISHMIWITQQSATGVDDGRDD